jgi:glycerophosphoryl diester phosphodiesterase
MTPRPRLLLYGHRGAAAERPENTLPSFERAVALGVDALEMDVHQTADGHVVVSHDPTGERMAGVAGEIRRSTLAEVQRWDAGWGFRDDCGDRPFAGRGYRIPTLVQVLERFAEIELNVDIKQLAPPMVEPLLALLRRHGAEPRTTLASFDAPTIRAVRARGFRGRTVLGRGEVVALLALPARLRERWPVAGDAVQIPARYGPLDLSAPWFVRRCHALGLRVDYWTIDEPTEAERLLTCGADGLMTNDPAAILPVVDRWRARPGAGRAEGE